MSHFQQSKLDEEFIIVSGYLPSKSNITIIEEVFFAVGFCGTKAFMGDVISDL